MSRCFSRGFDLLAKQEEQELDFRILNQAMGQGGNREILKWATPKAGIDLSEKRTILGKNREGVLLASKYHTTNNGRNCFWQQEQNHRVSL